jgi:hypothetical protein
MHDAGEIEYAVAVFAGSPDGGRLQPSRPPCSGGDPD